MKNPGGSFFICDYNVFEYGTSKSSGNIYTKDNVILPALPIAGYPVEYASSVIQPSLAEYHKKRAPSDLEKLIDEVCEEYPNDPDKVYSEIQLRYAKLWEEFTKTQPWRSNAVIKISRLERSYSGGVEKLLADIEIDPSPNLKSPEDLWNKILSGDLVIRPGHFWLRFDRERVYFNLTHFILRPPSESEIAARAT